MKILILCSDNSCLSQMAQGWLQSFDRTLIVHSAGISPAIEVHPLAVQTLASSGIDISHHKPEDASVWTASGCTSMAGLIPAE